MRMRLLVTGGAGYIGGIVVKRLLAEGHQAVVIDDLSTGYRDNIPSNVEFHQISLNDVGSVLTPKARFDGVIHLAAKALVAESLHRPDLYWETNVTGSLSLISAMRASGIKKIVFSSSCSVYRDSDRHILTEKTPVFPRNPYATSKLMVDFLLSAEAKASGIAASSLRYANAAGAVGGLGERHEPESHLIPTALKVAAGKVAHVVVNGTDYPTLDGTCVRDYVHVDDLARAHILAIAAVKPGHHRIYNLGTGQGFSNLEVIRSVRDVTGLPVTVVNGPRRKGDATISVVSGKRARKELGWAPKYTDLKYIVEDAWRFYQENLR